MTNPQERQRIKQAFDRAATSYDQHAILQKQVAATVVDLCQQYASQDLVNDILDLGAGTGFVTQALLQQYLQSHITALDLSQNMLDSIAEHSHLNKVCADFMQLPFNAASFDLLVSSLALQWGQDLVQLFSSLQSVLRPKGHLVFSTLLEDSLHELRQSWQQIDNQAHVNQFVGHTTLESSLHDAGWHIVMQRQENITLHYQTARDVLRAIKGIGANTVLDRKPSVKGLGGRDKISALNNAYELYRKAAGLPLSYKVMYIVATKDS